MNKKFSTALILGVLVLTGCNNEEVSNPIINATVDKDSEAIVEKSISYQEDAEDVSGDALDINETPAPTPISSEDDVIDDDLILGTIGESSTYTYTKEFKDELDKFLDSCSRCSFTQTNQNIGDDLTLSETINEINADTKTKVALWTEKGRTYADEKETEVSKATNYKMDLHYIKKDGKWVEDIGKSKVLNWKLNKFISTKDIYNYLVRGSKLPIGTEGEMIDDFCYFQVVKKATDKDITGIKYDSLGNKTVTYIFQTTLDGIVPMTVDTEIEVLINSKSYTCKSTIQFNSFGNDRLKMPKLQEER